MWNFNMIDVSVTNDNTIFTKVESFMKINRFPSQPGYLKRSTFEGKP